jgi:hypothetical protein
VVTRERVAPPGPGEPASAHQPFDRAAGHADVLSVELGPDLVGAIDEQVLVINPLDLHDELGVAHRTP